MTATLLLIVGGLLTVTSSLLLLLGGDPRRPLAAFAVGCTVLMAFAWLIDHAALMAMWTGLLTASAYGWHRTDTTETR